MKIKQFLSPNKISLLYGVGVFLILALPLLSAPPWFSPPDWGKTIIFRTVLSVLIFVFLAQLPISPKFRERFSEFCISPKFRERFSVQAIIRRFASASGFWLLFALFFIFFLSTIFSQDPFYGFWGDPHRSGGFLNFSFYILFALFLFFLLQKKELLQKGKVNTNGHKALMRDNFLNWQKIWDFSIIVGCLVALLAIFQQYEVFPGFLIASGRPGSTIGSSVLLSLYLLLLVFLTLIFGLKEKSLKKKVFYFLALFFLLFVIIFTTQSRTAYLGLLAGFSYFLFAYPSKRDTNIPARQSPSLDLPALSREASQPGALAGGRMKCKSTNKKIIGLKIVAALLLITLAYGIYYINTQPQLPQSVAKNKLLEGVLPRLKVGLAEDEPRYSVWAISWEAIKERPLLGWGMENFSIAFDKYYDPAFPFITPDWGSWYDRAHNIFFDLTVTLGFLGFLAFFSLFAVLFYRLQKTKRKYFHTPEYESQEGKQEGKLLEEEKKLKKGKDKDNFLICHALQATFLAYFTAVSFSFDTFSSYLILFLLVAYSLHLTSNEKIRRAGLLKLSQGRSNPPSKMQGFNPCKPCKLRKPLLLILLLALIWFVWAFNLKPLYINKEINTALAVTRGGNWPEGLSRLENVLPLNTFLNHYARMKYAEAINVVLSRTSARNVELAQKARDALKEAVKLRPTYTRDWLYLGIYNNFLTEKLWKQKPAKAQRFKEEADYAFEQAHRLSPKRQEIFVEWAKTFLVSEDYKKAKEKAKECIALNPSMGECWWLKGLANIYLGQKKEAQEDLRQAQRNRYDTQAQDSLFKLIEVYVQTKNYQELIAVHQKLIQKNPNNPQYYAALAYNYKVIGDYKKARKIAEKMLELFPAIKDKIEEFLKSLPE